MLTAISAQVYIPLVHQGSQLHALHTNIEKYPEAILKIHFVVVNDLDHCQKDFLLNSASQSLGFHLLGNFHCMHTQWRYICNQTSLLLTNFKMFFEKNRFTTLINILVKSIRMLASRDCFTESESVSCSVVSDSLQFSRLQPARLLCTWNSLGKNTEVGSHAVLQEIFQTQGSNLGFLHCRQILYHLSLLCFILLPYLSERIKLLFHN